MSLIKPKSLYITYAYYNPMLNHSINVVNLYVRLYRE